MVGGWVYRQQLVVVVVCCCVFLTLFSFFVFHHATVCKVFETIPLQIPA